MEFPDQLAAQLDVTLDSDIVHAVLDLARDVAHSTERRFAPVTAYVVGAYVAGRVATGADAHAAVADAQAAAAQLLAAK